MLSLLPRILNLFALIRGEKLQLSLNLQARASKLHARDLILRPRNWQLHARDGQLDGCN